MENDMKNWNWMKVLLLAVVTCCMFSGCSDSFNDIVLGVDETEGREIQIDSGGDAFIETRDGQKLYRDESGEFTSETPLPDPTPTPEVVSEANLAPFALVVLLSLLFTGCTTVNNVNPGGGLFSYVSFSSDSGTKANASASVSGYNRGGVNDTKAAEGPIDGGENWTDSQGGGEVSANTAVGESEASQEVADDPEEVAPEE